MKTLHGQLTAVGLSLLLLVLAKSALGVFALFAIGSYHKVLRKGGSAL